MESEERELLFDPAELFAQLSELLKLYLARAAQADALEAVSPKDAVGCSKTIVELMAVVQGGKLAAVEKDAPWPRLEFSPAESVGRGPVPRRLTSCRDNHGGPQVAALQDPPIQSLENAVSAVCQYDEETAILEPWALLLVRMNKLTQRVAADVEAWKASCAEHTPNGVGRADQPGSSAEDTEEFSAGDGGTGVSGTGVPPVILSKPAQSRTGGAPFGSEPQGRRQVPALQPEFHSQTHPNAKTPNHKNPRGP